MARKLTDRSAFDGETLAARFNAPTGTTAVAVTLSGKGKSKDFNATAQQDGTWKFTATPADLGGFEGNVRWVARATSPDGVDVIANGAIYLRPVRSKLWDVVDAIDEALKQWDTNPNHQISVGEITVVAKTRDDLMSARAFWEGKANADERGSSAPVGGPRTLRTKFGRA